MGILDTTHLRHARAKIHRVKMDVLEKYEETVEKPIAIQKSGIGDKTALTDRLNDPNNWIGTDDDNPWMRWRIKIKAWFAFSDKSPQGLGASFVFFPFTYLFPFTVWFTGLSWWYLFPIAVIPVARKWRSTPKILWAKKWGGYWRWEHVGNDSDESTARDNPKESSMPPGFYISRIQPWTRACVILFWPFCVVAWFYPNKEGMGTPYGVSAIKDSEIGFYRGWHYDDDGIFWGDGAGGPNFK